MTIYSCPDPDCGADLGDAGPELWCAACQRTVPDAQIAGDT